MPGHVWMGAGRRRRSFNDAITWADLGAEESDVLTYWVESAFTIYRVRRAAGPRAWVQKSQNFGGTWADLPADLPADVDTNHPTIIKLRSGTLLVGLAASATDLRVARSINEGATWAIINVYAQVAAFQSHQLFEIASGVIVGMYNLGGFAVFMKSTDDGLTWPSRTFFQPTAATVSTQVYQIPRSGNLLCHLFDNGTGTHYLYRSTDQAITWSQRKTDPIASALTPPGRGPFTQVPSTGRLVWMCKWTSDDDGLTWATGSPLPPNPGLPNSTLGWHTRLVAMQMNSLSDLYTSGDGVTWTLRVSMAPLGGVGYLGVADGSLESPLLPGSSMMGLLLNARIRRRRRVPEPTPG